MIEHHLKLEEKWVEIIKQNQQGQLENIGSMVLIRFFEVDRYVSIMTF